MRRWGSVPTPFLLCAWSLSGKKLNQHYRFASVSKNQELSHPFFFFFNSLSFLLGLSKHQKAWPGSRPGQRCGWRGNPAPLQGLPRLHHRDTLPRSSFCKEKKPQLFFSSFKGGGGRPGHRRGQWFFQLAKFKRALTRCLYRHPGNQPRTSLIRLPIGC